jgi:ferredoxin-NADP reductase
MTATEAAPPPAGAGTRRLAWRQAEVVERVAETRRATTLVLDVPDWPGHSAGQHVDVRLTAEDGYQAQRSYSIASPPEVSRLALTVERLEGAVPVRLLLSSRALADVIYREELDGLASALSGPGIVHTLTRERPPPEWRGYARRIDAPMLAEVGFPPAAAPKVFVCGPTPMVEAAAAALVGLGHEPGRVKTERFGATGGG